LIVVGNEECDDGNINGEDWCTNECKINKTSEEYKSNQSILKMSAA